MNAAHLHITLVHLPIVGVPLLTALLLWGYTRKKREVTEAALLFLVLLALCAIPAYLLGEGAEEVIEQLPGISKDAIEHHEDAALWAFILVLTTGFFSGLTLLLQKAVIERRGRAMLFLLGSCIVSSIALARTANLGGLIRHSEIMDTTPAAQPQERPGH